LANIFSARALARALLISDQALLALLTPLIVLMGILSGEVEGAAARVLARRIATGPFLQAHVTASFRLCIDAGTNKPRSR
jgi:hypothetical protein